MENGTEYVKAFICYFTILYIIIVVIDILLDMRPKKDIKYPTLEDLMFIEYGQERREHDHRRK